MNAGFRPFGLTEPITQVNIDILHTLFLQPPQNTDCITKYDEAPFNKQIQCCSEAPYNAGYLPEYKHSVLSAALLDCAFINTFSLYVLRHFTCNLPLFTIKD